MVQNWEQILNVLWLIKESGNQRGRGEKNVIQDLRQDVGLVSTLSATLSLKGGWAGFLFQDPFHPCNWISFFVSLSVCVTHILSFG